MTSSATARAVDLSTDQLVPGTRASLGLGVLAAATFAGVTTELLPIGLLPAMSVDLSASEAALGTAVTGYALVVALSATSLTVATARWPRRGLLVAVLALYALSSAIGAAAPDLTVLLAARLLGGLCHGVFWSMVAGYAARLVGPEQVGRATAAVFAGNALAVAVGLPVSAAVGAASGWRVAFLGVSAVTVVIAVLARVWLPPLAAARAPAPTTGEHPDGSVRAALAQPGVRAVAVVTGAVVLGHYTFFSYITVYLRDVGARGTTTSTALLAFGVAGVAGTLLLGRAYDRWPRTSFRVVTATLLGSLTALSVLGLLDQASWVAAVAVLAVTALGAAAVSLPAALQAMILSHAGPAPDAASSLFVAAFNLGISGGGLLGGLLLLVVGSAWLPLVALGVATGGAVLGTRGGSAVWRRPGSC